MTEPRTLYDKIWDEHVVNEQEDGTCLLYIDRHLVHEVTSPQAFEGLRDAGRGVRHPHRTLAVVDHNVPTTPDRKEGIKNEESRIQVEALAKNAADFGVEYFHEADIRQGIVHIVGPEQGFTLPGTTIVCGDSHTSTHGAFGALAHGIGTSEVEHVLATQTLIQKKAKNMLVRVDNAAPEGVTAKDIILAIIGEIGTAGGTGHVIEYAGQAITRPFDGRPHDGLQHVHRGRRARRPDRAGRQDLRVSEGPAPRAEGRPLGPGGGAIGRRCARMRVRNSTDRRRSTRSHLPPIVSWGSSPEDVVSGHRPCARTRMKFEDENKRASKWRALDYMGLDAGHEDHRYRDRPRVHRLVHQRTDRGPARRRGHPARKQRQRTRQRHGGARVRPG